MLALWETQFLQYPYWRLSKKADPFGPHATNFGLISGQILNFLKYGSREEPYTTIQFTSKISSLHLPCTISVYSCMKPSHWNICSLITFLALGENPLTI